MPMIEAGLGHRAATKVLMFRRLDADRQQDLKRGVRSCAHERRKGPGIETCLLKCILHAIARAVWPGITQFAVRPGRRKRRPLPSFRIRLQKLAPLFPLPFMRPFDPRDDSGVEIAPLRKLKAKLRNLVRHFGRGGQARPRTPSCRGHQNNSRPSALSAWTSRPMARASSAASFRQGIGCPSPSSTGTDFSQSAQSLAAACGTSRATSSR